VSEKVYFVQVGDDVRPSDMEQVADSLGGFLNNPDANALVVPETIKPLDRDEAREYLEAMADALDMEVSDK